jgi:hypothetical protein
MGTNFIIKHLKHGWRVEIHSDGEVRKGWGSSLSHALSALVEDVEAKPSLTIPIETFT